MKILVTGAAGFIGSHLAERLISLGHEVVGVDVFTDYYAIEQKELNAADVERAGARILRLNLASDDLAEAVNGVEVIYHSAAQPGISDKVRFEDYLANNLLATRALVDAARAQASLKLFVNVSTSSVYGRHATDSEETPARPTSYYGVTKLAAEQLVLAAQRDKGMPACSLRLFSVYGERERPDKLYTLLIRAILEDREFPLYEGSEHHTRSFTYVGDIVDGFVGVLDHIDRVNGEILNIGSDIEITTGEGIRIVEELMGRKARLLRKPPRSGDQHRTFANIEKARRLIGYEPRITPREGLQRQIDWARKRFAMPHD